MYDFSSRFHITVRLFSSRSQQDDVKMWYEQKGDTRDRKANLHVTDIQLHFDVFCESITEQMQGNTESICIIK